MIIGTGIDIVEIARLRRILAGNSERFRQRVFTPEEQRFCLAHRDPAPHFAARFAAKEAVFKALSGDGHNGIGWLDIEVTRQEQRAPEIALHGAALRLSRQKGVKNIHLSLTHSENWAAATAIIEGP